MSRWRRWPGVEPQSADPEAQRARLLQDLATAYRLFAALRWGELGDGHITCRDIAEPDHMWLLRAGIEFGQARATDMVLVAPDGSAVDQSGRSARINNSAYHIHHPIHEARPDVGAVAHTHTPWGTPFAAERRMIEPISQESALFFEDHALFDDEEVQILSCDGGKRIAVALGGCRAVTLANHGLLTVGSSPADAVGWFVLMERVCEVQMKAREAVAISGDAARAARDDIVGPDYGWDVFNWAIRRHLAPEDTSS